MADDEALLRRAFDVARRSRANGLQPFGALLAGPDGAVLIETENGSPGARDMTAHAERLLATQASQNYDAAFLSECTMYASTEPCAMCAGSIYWAGIGRLVFGFRSEGVKAMIGDPADEGLYLPCRKVFAAGKRAIAVTGPMLEAEAAQVHAGYWKAH